MRKILGLALPLFAVLGMTAVAAPSASAAQCGWYTEGRTGYHKHCGGTFILVKARWDTGFTYNTCQGPWSTIPFYPDGDHVQTGAWYVKTPPRVLTDVGGNKFCSASQPQD
ncbi:hypothetical protein GCM10022247_21260 [Allokutzneria multivorans]|uniref:Secreted protein n=1 Tax=Allokutzneria multivorans TaxID=1142134 RepID=A0ABP7RPY0_9PSEU